MLSGVILKILSDLGCYLSIAGLIGALFGAPSALIFGGWFVLTAAGVLSWLLRERGFWRFLPFLGAAAYFFFAHYQIAEAAVFLPPFALAAGDDGGYAGIDREEDTQHDHTRLAYQPHGGYFIRAERGDHHGIYHIDESHEDHFQHAGQGEAYVFFVHGNARGELTLV